MSPPSPDPAGTLAIHIQGAAVTITSSRPVGAARVFVGRPLPEVARRLPLVYSLCATAQAVACLRAAAQARRQAPDPAQQRAWVRLVAAETVKEHLWRLLLDWPGAVAAATGDDQPVGPDPRMADVMRLFAALRAALVGAGALAPVPVPAPTGESAGLGADWGTGPGAEQVAERGAGFRWPAAADVAGAGLADLAGAVVFGRPPGDWLAAVTDPDALAAWALAGGARTPARPAPLGAWLVQRLTTAGLAGLGRNPVATLPPGVLADLGARLGGTEGPAFAATPDLDGRPVETTPFARLSARPLIATLTAALGNGLLPRLVALLGELALAAVVIGQPESAWSDEVADWAAGLLPAAAGPRTAKADLGLGAVFAARGLLLHRLGLAGDTLTDYRILAPTEWNFHPAGVVAHGLAAIAAAGGDAQDLRRRAVLHITAVDPCVAYELSVC